MAIKTKKISDLSSISSTGSYLLGINLGTTGKISYEELESITTTKVTYAVDIKEKSEMPEVEQTEVKSAASRKPQRKVKS